MIPAQSEHRYRCYEQDPQTCVARTLCQDHSRGEEGKCDARRTLSEILKGMAQIEKKHPEINDSDPRDALVGSIERALRLNLSVYI